MDAEGSGNVSFLNMRCGGHGCVLVSMLYQGYQSTDITKCRVSSEMRSASRQATLSMPQLPRSLPRRIQERQEVYGSV